MSGTSPPLSVPKITPSTSAQSPTEAEQPGDHRPASENSSPPSSASSLLHSAYNTNTVYPNSTKRLPLPYKHNYIASLPHIASHPTSTLFRPSSVEPALTNTFLFSTHSHRIPLATSQYNYWIPFPCKDTSTATIAHVAQHQTSVLSLPETAAQATFTKFLSPLLEYNVYPTLTKFVKRSPTAAQRRCHSDCGIVARATLIGMPVIHLPVTNSQQL